MRRTSQAYIFHTFQHYEIKLCSFTNSETLFFTVVIIYRIYMGLSVLSLIFNSVFLCALCKSWKVVKQKRISYHTANLAFSDAMVGASTLLHYVVGDNSVGDVFIATAWTAILAYLVLA